MPNTEAVRDQCGRQPVRRGRRRRGQTVAGNTTDTLTGTVTDTDVITTEWALVSGPSVVLTGADTLTATFTGPIVTEATVLVFRLSATDAITTVSDECS